MERFDQNVPVECYLDRRDLDDRGGFEWLIEDLISDLENGYFLMWEAVVREEQELPLTEGQEEALSELMSFGDEDEDDRILYINERARPDEPWYQVVRKVVPHLLRSPFETYGTHYAVDLEGWPRLVECLEEHSRGLSLPEGVTTGDVTERLFEVGQRLPDELRDRILKMGWDVDEEPEQKSVRKEKKPGRNEP